MEHGTSPVQFHTDARSGTFADFCAKRNHSSPLKAQIPRPLKGQLAAISLDKLPVLCAGDGELQTLATLNLEGDVVSRAACVMKTVRSRGISRVRMGVARNVGALRHHFRIDRKARRSVDFPRVLFAVCLPFLLSIFFFAAGARLV